MEVKEKKNKGLIIAVVVLLILVIILSGYICYDKFLSNNNNAKQTTSSKKNKDNNSKQSKETDNNTINNSNNNDFDFNELSNTLYSSVQSGNLTTFVSKCETKPTNQGGPPETEQINTEVSNNTIDIIISKLKTAKTIDKNVTYSWFGCPPKLITYYISVNSDDQSQVYSQKVFSLNYANDDGILLVGYNNNGYAFHFNSNEEISNFIESLE